MYLPLSSHQASATLRWTPDREHAESNRSNALSMAAAVILALAAILGTGRALVFGDTFHAFAESRVARNTDLPAGKTDVLVYQVRNYLRYDGRDLMDQLAFSYRERLHFHEVRGLVREAQNSLYWAAHTGVILVLALLMQATLCGRYALALLGEFLSRFSFTLTLVVGGGLIMALNFNFSFYLLHDLVFESNNWLLPHDALTLQLFPRQYFVDLFTAWGAILTVLAAVSALGARLLRDSVHAAAARPRASRTAH